MPTQQMYWPMRAMALLTFAVLLLIPFRRFRAAFAGRVKPDDFKLGESPAVPSDVAIPNRNYMNLLELPVLFYVAALMFVSAGRVDPLALCLAWAYVALRVIHSAIHLTYNNVIHRLSVFALSNMVLGVFWAVFFLG